jgi:hypothetical protein
MIAVAIRRLAILSIGFQDLQQWLTMVSVLGADEKAIVNPRDLSHPVSNMLM